IPHGHSPCDGHKPGAGAHPLRLADPLTRVMASRHRSLAAAALGAIAGQYHQATGGYWLRESTPAEREQALLRFLDVRDGFGALRGIYAPHEFLRRAQEAEETLRAFRPPVDGLSGDEAEELDRLLWDAQLPLYRDSWDEKSGKWVETGILPAM